MRTTYGKNDRMSLREGQTTPYIDMLRANVPSVRVEITGTAPVRLAGRGPNGRLPVLLEEYARQMI